MTAKLKPSYSAGAIIYAHLALNGGQAPDPKTPFVEIARALVSDFGIDAAAQALDAATARVEAERPLNAALLHNQPLPADKLPEGTPVRYNADTQTQEAFVFEKWYPVAG